MTTRWLLDIATLASASSTVIQHHAVLRSQQALVLTSLSGLNIRRSGKPHAAEAQRPPNNDLASQRGEISQQTSNSFTSNVDASISQESARTAIKEKVTEKDIDSTTGHKTSFIGSEIIGPTSTQNRHTQHQPVSGPISDALRHQKDKSIGQSNTGEVSTSGALSGEDSEILYKSAAGRDPEPHLEETSTSDPDDLGRIFHNPRIKRNVLGSRPSARPFDSQASSDELPQWPPKDRFVDIPQDPIVLKGQNAENETTGAPVKADNSPVILHEPKIMKPVTESRNNMRESRVPSSRLGRMWQYASLGASMTFGAAAEGVRRISSPQSEGQSSIMLSDANMERLVSKLSQMRGAALKIGQLMSFQDSKMLPSTIRTVLQRVQDSADYMPQYQRNAVLEQNLGSNWWDMFSEFEEKPMAAASIGQVHAAVLARNSQPVAVKIQYPGVASSIDSDLNNLSMLLHASRLLPKGLYLDKTIANARTELAWECDYLREAEAIRKFHRLLVDESDVFKVPQVYDEASSTQVLTMERMRGVGITKLPELSQQQRDWIGSNILRLCLREISEFRYMQTDPNWTNFLYNGQTERIELLDFGASREYPKEFLIPYMKLLLAASKDDAGASRELSIQLGYLTGMESKTMLDAHIQSLTVLAEPFKASAPEVYDFSNQTITDRVRALIPIMLRERLAPPPEETYSLHRKLSGAFLLLARLGSRVKTREMFSNAIHKAGLSDL